MVHTAAMTTAQDLIAHVEKCLDDAKHDVSPLPPGVLAMEGMTGRRTRHFYNGLCRQGRKINYLEVGTWKGSSLIAAMYGNEANVSATVIDNWSQFNGPRDEFLHKSRYLAPDCNLKLLDQDCFGVTSLPPIDVYLYDGDHSYELQYKAMTHFAGFLRRPAIVVVDDWNWGSVRQGTLDGLRDVPGLKVEFSTEIRHTADDTHSPPDVAAAEFWNGIYVAVVA